MGGNAGQRLAADLEQQIHLVLATCYGLVSRNKALQDVYLDAYLSPEASAESTLSLPDDECQRIHEIVQSRDWAQVREELDKTLKRFDLNSRLLPLFQDALREWVGRGVTLFQTQGANGLEAFLAEVDEWLHRYRRKGGQVWVRRFINMFAYECKVSFFTCFANSWISIIPWLLQHEGLDEVSERFLRVWHHQRNLSNFRTDEPRNGILYPTSGGVQLFAPDHDGKLRPRSIAWETDQIGPTHQRAVFNGQVPSLHPLSGFFMKDAAPLAIAGRFFGSKRAYERVFVLGDTQFCGEYWDFVGAILAAAALTAAPGSPRTDPRPSRTSTCAEM